MSESNTADSHRAPPGREPGLHTPAPRASKQPCVRSPSPIRERRLEPPQRAPSDDRPPPPPSASPGMTSRKSRACRAHSPSLEVLAQKPLDHTDTREPAPPPAPAPGAARTPGVHRASPASPHLSRGTRNTGPSTKGHRRVQRLTSSRPLGFQVSARAKPARPIEGCDGAGREIGVKPRCRYIFYSTHGYRRITRERAGWPPPLGASSAVRSLDGGTVDPSVLGSIYIVTSAMMWAC